MSFRSAAVLHESNRAIPSRAVLLVSACNRATRDVTGRLTGRDTGLAWPWAQSALHGEARPRLSHRQHASHASGVPSMRPHLRNWRRLATDVAELTEIEVQQAGSSF